MSTTLVAALLAGFGLLAVLAVSYAFYLVGRAEDRDRERAAPPAAPHPDPDPERPPHRSPDHPQGEHRVARERRRPLPPRRPER
jgi:hypothetical protein